MIARGELHLTAVHHLAAHLTEENHREVLRRAKHRTTREIEKLVAELAPKPDVPSVIRKLPDRKASMPLAMGDESSPGASQRAAEQPSSAFKSRHEPKPRPVPLSPRRYKLQVTIGEETRDKLDELRGLLSHQVPDGDPVKILERALDALLVQARKKKAALTDKPRALSPKKNRNRGIPASVRRSVFQRDEGCCTFVDARGRRCSSSSITAFPTPAEARTTQRSSSSVAGPAISMKPSWTTGPDSWRRSGGRKLVASAALSRRFLWWVEARSVARP